MKFWVTIVKYGGFEVEAPNRDSATEKAEEDRHPNTIQWDHEYDVISVNESVD